MRQLTRRTALRGIAAAGSVGTGLALGAGGAGAAASASTDRHLVFTEGASKHRLTGLDVVHRLDRIGVRVVRAGRSELHGVLSVPDRPLDHPDPYRPKRTVDPTELVERVAGARDAVPGDPLTPFQWDKRSQGVFDAWAEARGEGTRVSVIDDGVYPHPDLDGPLDADLSRNFTEDGGGFEPVPGATHGTHVAGIVAAEENGAGVVGTAPDVDLVACRVFSGTGAFVGDIIAAMLYSVEVGADVVNMSFGALYEADDPTARVFEGLYELVALLGYQEGTLFVAAAGNDSVDLDESSLTMLPAGAPSITSISATGPIGYLWDDPANPGPGFDPLDHLRKPTSEPAFYTNCGARALSVSAPGGNTLPEILTQPPEERPENWFFDLVLNAVVDWGEEGEEPTPTYGWQAGTSMASPQVVGAAALVHSLAPGTPPSLLRRHLERTAAGTDSATCHGAGHLDTRAAVRDPIAAEEATAAVSEPRVTIDAGPLTLDLEAEAETG